MDYSQNYSFVSSCALEGQSDTPSRPTSVTPSRPYHSPVQAPLPPAINLDCHKTFGRAFDKSRDLSTHDFGLPLRGPTGLGFGPDLQSTASRRRVTFLEHYLPENALHFSGNSSPSGEQLRAHSATVSFPVPFSLSLPLSLRASSHLPFGSKASAGASEPSESLLLEDFCILEPDMGTPTPAASVTFADHGIRPSSADGVELADSRPYSECPATEFSALTWSPLSSVMSLQYPSLPESQSDYGILLKKESNDDLLRFSPLRDACDEDAFGSEPLLGIYADINLRELMVEEQDPPACVNPADIMGFGDSCMTYASFTSNSASPEVQTISTRCSTATPALSATLLSQTQTPADRQSTSSPGFASSASGPAIAESSFSDDAISAIVTVLKTSAKQEGQDLPLSPADHSQMVDSIQPCQLVAPQPLYPSQLQAFPRVDPRMHHPSLAPAAHGLFPGPRAPLAELHMQQTSYPAYGAYPPFGFQQGLLQPVATMPPPQSPVLNAHTGIDLEDLRRRANDYRLRDPMAELDKNFLQSFAGRLSARGELLDEYRCYVNGCGQRNKRRDHILVHVGSHVEHRPWRCDTCGMRFLRKNECKRHESSHGGRKPFSCQICAPHQERNFVRQDLLKRHMRVTHGVHESSRLSKKRIDIRKQEDAEYWP